MYFCQRISVVTSYPAGFHLRPYTTFIFEICGGISPWIDPKLTPRHNIQVSLHEMIVCYVITWVVPQVWANIGQTCRWMVDGFWLWVGERHHECDVLLFLYVLRMNLKPSGWLHCQRTIITFIIHWHTPSRSNSTKNELKNRFNFTFISPRFGSKPSLSYNEATFTETYEKFRWGYEDNSNSVASGNNVKTFPRASQWFVFWPFGQLASSAWQECWNLSQAVWCCSCCGVGCWCTLHHRQICFGWHLYPISTFFPSPSLFFPLFTSPSLPSFYSAQSPGSLGTSRGDF